MSDKDRVIKSVGQTRSAVLGVGPPAFSSSSGEGENGDGGTQEREAYVDAHTQAVAKAVQSIAQSAAISVQDATDMMRNVTTVEVTAIGVATAKWIADPSNVQYVEIINKALSTLKETALLYETMGQKAANVLKQFQQTP